MVTRPALIADYGEITANGVVELQMSNERNHLTQALHWSKDIGVDWVGALASGIGMTAPIALGAATGQLALGLTASVGALAVSGAGRGASAKAQVKSLAWAFAAVVAPSVATALVAGHGALTQVMVVMLVCLAATVGGYSRPLAVATIRFVLFLIITLNLATAVAHPVQLLTLMVAGALWTSFVTVLLRACWRGHIDSSENKPASTASAAQKFRRWQRSLTHLSGWNYTLRLGLSLSLAGVLQWLWPEHHLYWISVAVAILTRRKLERFPIQTTQRAMGTALGVLAAGWLLMMQPPVWGLILAIGLLALVRPVLKTKNYLAYSAAMTPLIILIMDVGQPPGFGVLVDRLLATVLAAALVLAANHIFSRFAMPPEPAAPL